MITKQGSTALSDLPPFQMETLVVATKQLGDDAQDLPVVIIPVRSVQLNEPDELRLP